MKKLILLFLFLPCLVSAHTLVIGTGSGGFSQSSMGSLSPGDTLAIKAGNYSGSIGLQALTDITVIPYGGNVVITGSNAWQLDNLTNVNITSYNGYSFQFTNCSNDAFYLASACTGLFFNGIQCNNVQGIFLDASSSGSPYVYYNGTQASLILYNAAITNCKFTGCQMIFQGDYTAPSNLRNFVDSLVFAYDTVTQTATNGLEINGNITRLSVHHDLIKFSGINTLTDDVGFAYFEGWGYFYDNVISGGRGYLARDFLYSLADNPGTSLMYNNLKYNTSAYGLFDMRCDNTAYGQFCTSANFHIFNNPIGNCYDNAFIAPLVVVYQMNGGATGRVNNNFGFNLTYNSGGSFITSFDNWVYDTASNIYTQSNALSYLQDTLNFFQPLQKSILNTAGVPEPTASPDIWNFTCDNHRIGAVCYKYNEALALTPDTIRVVRDNYTLKLYPNPAHSRATLEIGTQTSGPLTINIYDMYDRNIATISDYKTGFYYSKSFNVASFGSGVYVVKTNINGMTLLTNKLIIAR